MLLLRECLFKDGKVNDIREKNVVPEGSCRVFNGI